MPSIVEDFAYPGAEAIDQEQGIRLISGDGGILLATCDGSDDLIEVESLTRQICFRAPGETGLLLLEIPDVYLITGGDEPVTATVTADGESVQHQVEPGMPESVMTTGGDFSVLVELRVRSGQ